MGKVTLSAIGLSPQEGTVVNVVANLMAAFDHSVQVLDAGDVTGDIVLIGDKGDAARATLGSLGKEQRAVLFVDEESEVRGYPVLTRPIRVQSLRDLLADLVPALPDRSQLPARPQPIAPTAGTVTTASALPPPNLFYLVLEAVINRAMVRIAHEGQMVLVHGPTQCIYTQLDGAALEQLSRLATPLHFEKLVESDFMRAAKGLSLTRLHDVIWLAERYGSQGVLLQGHSSEVPVRLKVWPKFNNRHVRPEYLKLAALLSKQPLTLHNLAEASGVALPKVIDFYNTAVAFGVIEIEKSMTGVPQPTSKPSTSNGLLGKIAKRLALKRD